MITDLRKPDDVLRTYLVFMVIFMAMAGWVAQVFITYDTEQMPFTVMWYALKASADTPKLWIGASIGTFIGVALAVVIFKYFKTGYNGSYFQTRLKGAYMVSRASLRSKTKKGKNQLVFGSVEVPQAVEGTHFLAVGSTGVGKSVSIGEYIESAINRGDRIICVDPDGGFMKHFFKEGDKILNPFDVRGEGWSIFNEIRSDFDCVQFAISMIPRSPSTEQEAWNSMARTIVSETLHILVKKGNANAETLLYWVTKVSMAELHDLLKDTPAASCFDAEQTMASIRTVLTNYVVPHKFLKEGDFSIRDWLENGTGNLWITWRDDLLQALKPLVSCWVDVICASVLSMEEDRDRRIHLIADELDSLEKLNYMIDAATKGRKKGLRLAPGIQSFAQLNKTYGEQDATTLRGCFRSAFLCGIGDLDNYSAEEASKALGEHTVIRKEVSSTGGTTGAKASLSNRSITERIVSPTEIHLLPNLTGYLKFAGDYPVCKIKMTYKKRPIVTEPMIMNEALHEIVRTKE